MKELTIIFLFFVSVITFSQQKMNFALEGGVSMFNAFETNIAPFMDVNLIIQYKNYELYGGIIETSAAEISFINKEYSVSNPVLGAKYHLKNKKRQSHFFIDINIQWRNYYSSFCFPPLGGNTKNLNSWIDCITHKVNTFNTHINMGYELITLNRISFPLTIGIGVAKHKGEVFPTGLSSGLSDIDKLEVSPYIKIGFRLYFIKKL